jgi:hypothetical protein
MIDWLETGEHVVRFGHGLERHTIAESEEFFLHRQHPRVFVRGVDRFSGFPFRDFDDRAVARAHDRRDSIRHQSLFTQRRNTSANKLEKVVFLSSFGPVSYDCANGIH